MSEQPPTSFFKRLLSSPTFRAYLYSHRHAICYTIIGFLLGVSVLALGFWRTLVLAGLIYLGNLLGSYRDGNPRVRKQLVRFYQYWIEDNPFMK